jgi:hypothetical protein
MKTTPTILIIVLLSVSLFAGCRKNSAFTEIHFGGGGGFTGRYTDYTIDDDGGVYISENSTTTFIKNIGKAKTLIIQDKIDAVPSSVWGTNHPYNITSFIAVHTENGIRRIDWGDPAYPVAGEVQELYDYMEQQLN